MESGLFRFHLAKVFLSDVECFFRHFVFLPFLVVAEGFAGVTAVELAFGPVLAVITGNLGRGKKGCRVSS
jgi:hypothetical protein